MGSDESHAATGYLLFSKRGNILSIYLRPIFTKDGHDRWIHAPSKQIGRDIILRPKRPRPRCGKLHRSPRSLSWWGGGLLPLTRT